MNAGAAIQANELLYGYRFSSLVFNPAMLSHLSGVGREDAVRLTISTESVAVRRNDASVVEKRVTLPKRWLKGLCEVQVYQSRLRHRFTPAMIVPLLHSASRATSGPQYLSLAGGRPRLSTRRSSEAIAVGGASCLSALRTLLPIVREFRRLCDERPHQTLSGEISFLLGAGALDYPQTASSRLLSRRKRPWLDSCTSKAR